MKRWRTADAAIVIVTLAVLLAAQAALVLPLKALGLLNATSGVALTYAPTVLTALVVLLLAWCRGMRLRDLGFVRPASWRPVLYVWAGAMLVNVGYAALSAVLGGRFDSSPASMGAVLAMNAAPIVVVAPVAEELIFRAAVFGSVRSRWPLIPAVILVGILFAAFHLKLTELIPLSIIGGLFAYLYDRTGSLWASIAAHAGLNAIWLVGLLAAGFFLR